MIRHVSRVSAKWNKETGADLQHAAVPHFWRRRLQQFRASGNADLDVGEIKQAPACHCKL
jgi:hypothetical protein